MVSKKTGKPKYTKKKGGLTKQAKAEVKRIAKDDRLKEEDACYTGTLNSSTLSTTPQVLYNFYNIGADNASVDNTKRNSQKIKMLYLRVRGTVFPGDPSNRVRLMLVKQLRPCTQTTNPFVADPDAVFNDKSGLGSSYIDMMSNTKLVKILKEKTFNLQIQNPGSVYPPTKEIDMFIPINKELDYPVNTATNNDFPTDGENIFLMGVSDSAVVPHPACRLRCELCWKNIGN